MIIRWPSSYTDVVYTYSISLKKSKSDKSGNITGNWKIYNHKHFKHWENVCYRTIEQIVLLPNKKPECCRNTSSLARRVKPSLPTVFSTDRIPNGSNSAAKWPRDYRIIQNYIYIRYVYIYIYMYISIRVENISRIRMRTQLIKL